MRLAFRHARQRDLANLAEIVGQDSASALALGDSNAASQSLSALRTNPEIMAARAYSKEGKILAEYHRANVSIPLPPKALRGETNSHGLHRLALFHPITRNGDVVGTIYVESDGKESGGWLRRNVMMALIAMLAAAGVTWLLSLRLQHLISDPIAGLVQTSQAAMGKGDSSLFAPERVPGTNWAS